MGDHIWPSGYPKLLEVVAQRKCQQLKGKKPAKTGCLQVISTDLPKVLCPPLNNLLGKKGRVNAILPRVTVLNRMAPHEGGKSSPPLFERFKAPQVIELKKPNRINHRMFSDLVRLHLYLFYTRKRSTQYFRYEGYIVQDSLSSYSILINIK